MQTSSKSDFSGPFFGSGRQTARDDRRCGAEAHFSHEPALEYVTRVTNN
ncbi:hypothetical protein [Wenzhouxiangella sediminis]|nr:hypothetical protein [Wenzhouxiangella sediminis]